MICDKRVAGDKAREKLALGQARQLGWGSSRAGNCGNPLLRVMMDN